jgi:cytochrome c biogenesis protein CcmG/thiol:disulfide interchange protein DsbE
MTRRLFFVLPVLIFAAAALAFWLGLTGDRRPDSIPSVLLDRPAPAFDLPPVEGLGVPGLGTADLATLEAGGQVTVLNLWASWCLPCRAEHPLLVELAQEPGVRLVGINYKDKPADARGFLLGLGNPFARVGADADGRAGIEWGISGVPETFILDARGIVRFRWVGPLNRVDLQDKILPLIRSQQ